MSKTVIIILVLGILLLLWLVPIPFFYWREKKRYNEGKCKCGGHWRWFSTDSTGAYGFVCDNCKKVIWNNWYKDF